MRQTARKNFQLEFIFQEKMLHIRLLLKIFINRTLVEKFCDQFGARFFGNRIHFVYNKYPENRLRQASRNFFQLEIDFLYYIYKK